MSEFRELMTAAFGPHRAVSVAESHVSAALDGRTPAQALEDGEDPRRIWRVVCADFDVPEVLHHGLPD